MRYIYRDDAVSLDSFNVARVPCNAIHFSRSFSFKVRFAWSFVNAPHLGVSQVSCLGVLHMLPYEELFGSEGNSDDDLDVASLPAPSVPNLCVIRDCVGPEEQATILQHIEAHKLFTSGSNQAITYGGIPPWVDFLVDRLRPYLPRQGSPLFDQSIINYYAVGGPFANTRLPVPYLPSFPFIILAPSLVAQPNPMRLHVCMVMQKQRAPCLGFHWIH